MIGIEHPIELASEIGLKRYLDLDPLVEVVVVERLEFLVLESEIDIEHELLLEPDRESELALELEPCLDR